MARNTLPQVHPTGFERHLRREKAILSLRRLARSWEKEAATLPDGSLPAYLLYMAKQVKRRLPRGI